MTRPARPGVAGSCRLGKCDSWAGADRAIWWRNGARGCRAGRGTARSRKATEKPAAGKRRIEQYVHKGQRRKNNPPVGLVTEATDRDTSRKQYAYDPHLDPTLTWAGKAKHTSFELPTVSLHVHERIDPKTIMEAVRRRNGTPAPVQGSLFESPEENPPLREAIDFYQHAHPWSNRLIAGDSLLVMNSLLEKEGMAGKVQFVVLICYRRLGMMIGGGVQSSAHYLIWYARDKSKLKQRKLFSNQVAGVGTGDHYVQSENGRPFQLVSLATGGYRPNTTIDYEFHGRVFHPGPNKCWRTTKEGLDRLAAVGRIARAGNTIRYKQFLDDFPFVETTTIWEDTARDPQNIYVV